MKQVFWFSAATIAALAAIGGASPASATLVVPSATYGSSLGKYADFTSVYFTGVGTHSDGFSTVSVGALPSPFIQAHAVGGVGNGNPSVSGNIDYYVGVDGPSDGTFVPINVAYTMHGNEALTGYAYDPYAQADLTLLSYDHGNPLSLVFLTQNGNYDVTGTASWEIASGSTGEVRMHTRAGFAVGVFNGIFGSGTVDANLDPVFTIDAAYAASHPNVRLVFSEGVGNGAAGAVPEPASWVLMMGGFSSIGLVARRRRRGSAQLTA